MVWIKITRAQYRREDMRYESDTTDGEWLVMKPLLPPPSALGRPRETDKPPRQRAIAQRFRALARLGRVGPDQILPEFGVKLSRRRMLPTGLSGNQPPAQAFRM